MTGEVIHAPWAGLLLSRLEEASTAPSKKSKHFSRKVKVTQSHPTLCDSMDYTVHEFSRPEYWSG